MSPTIVAPFRADFRPVAVTEFREHTGRVDTQSATGCSIRSRYRVEPGTTLELRVYLPGAHWPVCVQRADVIGSHWGEFTVEFRDLSIRDQDQLQRCLVDALALAAA